MSEKTGVDVLALIGSAAGVLKFGSSTGDHSRKLYVAANRVAELMEAAQDVAYGNWNHAAVEEITRLREALMACRSHAKDK